MTDKRIVDVLFTEILNRHEGFLIQQIRLKFEGEDVFDVYQEFSIHLYQTLQSKYSSDLDLFSSKAWLKAVVSNFCISQIRKKNKKRAVHFVAENKTSFIQSIYSDESFNADRKPGEPNFFSAMIEALSHLNKRDALILKMKYYYGRPSSSISRLLNIAHVDVTIGRLKQRIKRKSGIDNLDELLEKYDWLQ